jgi:hypothetical protein
MAQVGVGSFRSRQFREGWPLIAVPELAAWCRTGCQVFDQITKGLPDGGPLSFADRRNDLVPLVSERRYLSGKLGNGVAVDLQRPGRVYRLGLRVACRIRQEQG